MKIKWAISGIRLKRRLLITHDALHARPRLVEVEVVVVIVVFVGGPISEYQ